MNNFTTNLEKSIKEVSALIKENKIQHRAVKDLIKNIMIYDYCNDKYMSEVEIGIGTLKYKLNLFEKCFPESYFILDNNKITMVNPIPGTNISINVEY